MCDSDLSKSSAINIDGGVLSSHSIGVGVIHERARRGRACPRGQSAAPPHSCRQLRAPPVAAASYERGMSFSYGRIAAFA
eukprot:scaffold30120_cov56-Phaeocystis_antarctica.AAC.3